MSVDLWRSENDVGGANSGIWRMNIIIGQVWAALIVVDFFGVSVWPPTPELVILGHWSPLRMRLYYSI